MPLSVGEYSQAILARDSIFGSNRPLYQQLEDYMPIASSVHAARHNMSPFGLSSASEGAGSTVGALFAAALAAGIGYGIGYGAASSHGLSDAQATRVGLEAMSAGMSGTPLKFASTKKYASVSSTLAGLGSIAVTGIGVAFFILRDAATTAGTLTGMLTSPPSDRISIVKKDLETVKLEELADYVERRKQELRDRYYASLNKL